MSTDFMAIFGSISLLALASLGAALHLRHAGNNHRFIPRAEAVRRATEDAMWGHFGGAVVILASMVFDIPSLFVISVVFYCLWVVFTVVVQVKKITDLHKSCEICDAGIR